MNFKTFVLSFYFLLSRSHFLSFLLLFLVGSIVYANALHTPFQFDDQEFIVNFPLVREPSLILQNWDHPYVGKRKIFTYLSFALNYKWGGLNTFGYHLVNVILHIATAFVLYLTVGCLMNTPVLKETVLYKKRIFALSVALIFIVHPLQTQAVTYIWQRAEILSGFFYLSTYLCYLIARIRKGKAFYVMAGFLFIVGIHTKGTIVSLPFLILLTEFLFFKLSRKQKIFSLMGVAMLTIFVLWQIGKLNHVISNLLFFRPDSVGHDYYSYVWTQMKVAVKYIQLSFFPFNQNVDHYVSPSFSFFEIETMGAVGLLFIIFALAVMLSFNKPLVSFGICWFFIYLLPTSLGQPSVEFMMEHRLYLSLAGFAIFVVSGLFLFIHKDLLRNLIILGIILSLGILTIARNYIWASPVTLMEDAISKAPWNPRPYSILGTIYLQQNRWEEAYDMFQKSLHFSPRNLDSHNNIGIIYLRRGQLDLAEKEFRTNMLIKPNWPPSYVNMAYIYLVQGQEDKAKDVLEQHIDLFEKYDRALTLLGEIYLKQRNLNKAQQYFQAAIRLHPYNETAYVGLANAYHLEGRLEEARLWYEKALQLNPRSQEIFNRLVDINEALH